ncbi:MAG: histidinol-phosphatase [Anaerolineae bacterium]|nr:MAG: histidinol-phosphatase [Anaerolineae bacterium]
MNTLRVEFHCHTIYSKDSLVRPQQLVETARRKGLDRLIVTDHNSIGGALETQRLAPELVIIGEEILTTHGELLAAFVREEIPAGLEPLEVIRRLKAQGAFIGVSHPLDPLRGWKREHLLEILPHVDALEVFNARCVDMRYNDAARAFALEHGLPGIVGSDAHTLMELGRATLTLPAFHNAESLRNALPAATPQVRLSSPLVHLASRWAVFAKKHRLVQQPPQLNATPTEENPVR